MVDGSKEFFVERCNRIWISSFKVSKKEYTRNFRKYAVKFGFGSNFLENDDFLAVRHFEALQCIGQTQFHS